MLIENRGADGAKLVLAIFVAGAVLFFLSTRPHGSLMRDLGIRQRAVTTVLCPCCRGFGVIEPAERPAHTKRGFLSAVIDLPLGVVVDLTEPCPVCGGCGRVESSISIIDLDHPSRRPWVGHTRGE